MHDRICTSRITSAVPKLAGAAAVAAAAVTAAAALAIVGSSAWAEPISGAVTYRQQSALPALPTLPVPATYSGTLPCASCPGIRATLTLFEGGTYRRRLVYLEAGDGEDRAVADAGRWRMEGRRLLLIGAEDQGGQYEVVSANVLRLLSNKGLPFESGLPYELLRSPELDRFGGDADAGASPAAEIAATAASGHASLCFGNEPSWSLDLAAPGEARFRMLGAEPVAYHGRETRSEPIRERIWRGAPEEAAGGDLVAFLVETDCNDGMSDINHPVSVRVSLPDGRFLAGCCRVPTTPESTQSSARAAIEGFTWRLVSLSGLSPDVLGSARRPVTALFEGGRVTGFSGCNQFTGSYTLDADRVALGALVATRMACPEPAMSIETLFHEAFAGSLRATPAEGRLTLASEPGASSPATLVFEAERPPSVRGTSWEVTGYNNGREAVVSTVRGTTLTLAFGDGTVSGNSGCNTFHAAYEVDGDRLILKPVASTRRMCNGEGIMEQERLFLAALQGALTWTIRGDVLDLSAPGGARALTARKASQ